MKRITLLLAGWMLWALGGSAEPPLQAKLTRADGRAWRVFLTGCTAEQLMYRLEKSPVEKTLPLSDVQSILIKLPKLDLEALRARLRAADYGGVISVLEPVVLAAGPYMAVSNNATPAFALLTKAYLRDGEPTKARDAAAQLLLSQDPGLKRSALEITAQAALEAGDLTAAKSGLEKMKDPAAKLYLTARIQRAEQQSKKAMQTVVELIASHPNNMEWMPQTETLCAELYIDLGMLESAAEVARQVEVLYPRSEFKVEAKALREKIKQLTEQSAESE